MLIVKIVENNVMYSVQELHLCLFSSPAEVTLANFTCSTFLVHSSVGLSTNSFLLLQFL